jgi:tRNA-splicing ligase RtcB
MKLDLFKQRDEFSWEIPAQGRMRVPAMIYADRALIEAMDDNVYQQAINVATLPGIVDFAYAMPDAHWGYGFPIGGVAAFDADEGGVVSAGGVGFDISCGVRCLHTGLAADDIELAAEALADELYRRVPAGVGSTGLIHLGPKEMNKMLAGGAQWAVQKGYGSADDLERTEERGCMQGADPGQVSEKARHRQRNEMGTLGSGNHYLEVQCIDQIYDEPIAAAFGLCQGEAVVSIHCGSRGLGHQIGTEFLRLMATSAGQHGIALPDRELACAPIKSDTGRSYLGAMRSAINCALANRQIITHLTRQSFEVVFPGSHLPLLYDVSHNTCKLETHTRDGQTRRLYVHRKGATRAFGPAHPELPAALRAAGQPVLIGGSMGTCSYILAGTAESEQRAFSSACHGAGRAMSRRQARRQWRGWEIIDDLRRRGIIVHSPSLRGVAEEAPLAYKDVAEVVDAADHAGLARKVARVRPLVCVKG